MVYLRFLCETKKKTWNGVKFKLFFCLSSIIVYVNCSNRKYKGHIYIHIIYTRHIIKSTTLIIISTLNKISTKIIITNTYTIKKIVWYGQKLFFMGVLNNYDWNQLGVGARSKPVSTQHSVRQDINYNKYQKSSNYYF